MMVCTISHQNYPEMVQDFTQVGRQRTIELKRTAGAGRQRTIELKRTAGVVRQRTANVQLTAGVVRQRTFMLEGSAAQVAAPPSESNRPLAYRQRTFKIFFEKRE